MFDEALGRLHGLGYATAASVAICVAFRDVLRDPAAGTLILLTRPFRIVDQIRHDGQERTVEDIWKRATVRAEAHLSAGERS